MAKTSDRHIHASGRQSDLTMMETQPLRVLVLYWPFRNILDFSIPISQSMPHCDWISEIHHLVTRNHELESRNDNKILAKVHGSTIDKFYPFVANLTKFFLPTLQPIFICRDYPTHPPDLAWLPILGTTPGPISHNLSISLLFPVPQSINKLHLWDNKIF